MLNRSLKLALAVLSSYVSVALAETMDKIDPAKFDQSLLSEAYRFVQENYESQLDPSDYREIRIFWSNERRTYHLSLIYDDPESTIPGATIFVSCIFREDGQNTCGSKRRVPPLPPQMIDPPIKDEDSGKVPAAKSNIPLEDDGRAAPQLGR